MTTPSSHGSATPLTLSIATCSQWPGRAGCLTRMPNDSRRPGSASAAANRSSDAVRSSGWSWSIGCESTDQLDAARRRGVSFQPMRASPSSTKQSAKSPSRIGAGVDLVGHVVGEYDARIGVDPRGRRGVEPEPPGGRVAVQAGVAVGGGLEDVRPGATDRIGPGDERAGGVVAVGDESVVDHVARDRDRCDRYVCHAGTPAPAGNGFGRPERRLEAGPAAEITHGAGGSDGPDSRPASGRSGGTHHEASARRRARDRWWWLSPRVAGATRRRGAGAPPRRPRAARAGPTSADFGTLTDVCQKGTPSGSPAPGVTPTEIKIGTFADPGFAGRPGLDQELFDTANVFSKWCNDAGGINGRKIVVNKRDAALFNVKARMTEACATTSCWSAAARVRPGRRRHPARVPDARDRRLRGEPAGARRRPPHPAGPELARKSADRRLQVPRREVPGRRRTTYGVLTGDVETTKIVAPTARRGQGARLEEGLRRRLPRRRPERLDAVRAEAQGQRDEGPDLGRRAGEPRRAARRLNDIGYPLDFIRTDANHYDQKLIDTGGSAVATNVYIRSAFDPFENAKPTNPTGVPRRVQEVPAERQGRTYLGLQAWSAWLLFATAANECGNNLTRKCVYDNAKKINEWTGGGLHAETSPGTTGATECFALEQATPDGFELVKDTEPNDGIYNCDPKNLYTLPVEPADDTTMADVGQKIRT